MGEKILVALGGNALVQAGQQGTIEEQRSNLHQSLIGVLALIQRGFRVVITHGNGPQVGHILMRVEEARHKAYDLPLDVCVAQSQGEIGYLIQQSLQNLLHRQGLDRSVATVICRTVVNRDDERMKNPSKPVGPFFSREEAASLMQEGYSMVEDSRRGFRRVVPSPEPIDIVEKEIIRRLFDDDVIPITVGGGGIPVSVGRDGSLRGVEAVVDKDLASSQLALAIGVERILDLTAVEHAKLNFDTPTEQNLDTMTVTEAKKYLAEGHFAPGSMGPKIEAAIYFLERGGREVIITHTDKTLEGFEGRTGTHIYPDRKGATT